MEVDATIQHERAVNLISTQVAAADAHSDAVHDDLWVDAVDVRAADGLERALDLPQARGRVPPVDGPVVLTVVCVFIDPIYNHLRRLASGGHMDVVSLDGGAWRPGWLLLPRASFNLLFL